MFCVFPTYSTNWPDIRAYIEVDMALQVLLGRADLIFTHEASHLPL
jgi:hypothetical protein